MSLKDLRQLVEQDAVKYANLANQCAKAMATAYPSQFFGLRRQRDLWLRRERAAREFLETLSERYNGAA